MNTCLFIPQHQSRYNFLLLYFFLSQTQKSDGGQTNVAYTFGGQYESGDRADEASYVNSPGLGSFNDDPRRVNAKMYGHVSTRGTCVARTDSPPTGSPTSLPTKVRFPARIYLKVIYFHFTHAETIFIHIFDAEPSY